MTRDPIRAISHHPENKRVQCQSRAAVTKRRTQTKKLPYSRESTQTKPRSDALLALYNSRESLFSPLFRHVHSTGPSATARRAASACTRHGTRANYRVAEGKQIGVGPRPRARQCLSQRARDTSDAHIKSPQNSLFPATRPSSLALARV